MYFSYETKHQPTKDGVFENLNKALKYHQKKVDLEPDNYLGYFILAGMYQAGGNYYRTNNDNETAKKLYWRAYDEGMKALKYYHGNPQVWHLILEIANQIGLKNEAIKADDIYRRIIEADKNK